MTDFVRATPAPHTIRIGASRVPVVGPRVTDPRLHVAAVVVTIQVLGQTVLHFDLSIVQILAAIVTCAAIEVTVTLRRQHALVWPASALLTGNGVALILRVPGTAHGDWWATDGLWIFAAVGAVSLASKYLIRVDDRPLFNPSNFGLVLVFLALGPRHVAPLDLWWVNMGTALTVAYAVIVVGGIALAIRVRMVGVVVSFWVTLAVTAGLIAASGHCMTARWHLGPICGAEYWGLLISSPEILVFLFFMITDPKTAPRGRVSRVIFGAGVSAASMLLASFQQTEYATKVAILAGLLVACACRPLLERTLPAPGASADRLGEWWRAGRTAGRRTARGFVIAGLVIAGGLVAGGASTGGSGPRRAIVSPPGCQRELDRPTPRPKLATGPIPKVNNRPSVGVTDRFSDRQASLVARDTVEDLLIIGRARRTRQPGLTATAAVPPRVTHEITAICAAARSGAIEAAEHYTFDAISVQILTRTATQRIPEIDVRLRGHVDLITYRDGQPTGRRRARYDEMLTVDYVEPNYLIEERTPPLPRDRFPDGG